MRVLQDLIDELTTDPKGLGYAAKTNEECLTALLTVGLSGDTKPRESVTSQELVEALDADEFLLLPVTAQNLFLAIVSAESIPFTSKLRATMGTLFGGTVKTKAALLELVSQPISRAEAIGWPNVALGNIQGARP